jgi:protein-S-isoprenylcysteine O-methyltransferase Ste14
MLFFGGFFHPTITNLKSFLVVVFIKKSQSLGTRCFHLKVTNPMYFLLLLLFSFNNHKPLGLLFFVVVFIQKSQTLGPSFCGCFHFKSHKH